MYIVRLIRVELFPGIFTIQTFGMTTSIFLFLNHNYLFVTWRHYYHYYFLAVSRHLFFHYSFYSLYFIALLVCENDCKKYFESANRVKNHEECILLYACCMLCNMHTLSGPIPNPALLYYYLLFTSTPQLLSIIREFKDQKIWIIHISKRKNNNHTYVYMLLYV